MSADIFELFSGVKAPEKILEYLDSAAYDRLSEADLPKDRFRVLYRAEGKFAGPVNDSAFSEIRSYAGNRFVHPEDRKAYFDLTEPETLVRRFAESKYPGILSAQYRLLTQAGEYRWVEETLVCGERFGLPPGIMRIYHFDIQLQKNRRLGLALSAQGKRKRDEVTGLLVGDSFFPAAQAMLSIPTEKGRWCLLFISIEHLKLFREWFGKETASELLSRLGAVLREEASETGGLAAHLWDDDFLLLTPYEEERVRALYEKLHARIRDYGIPVGFLPVIGISEEKEGGTVLSMADRAALAAASLKGNFRTRIGLYKPEMGDRTRQEYRLLSELQQAIQSHEIYFVLQPQCRADTGRIVGAEALVRWKKADGSVVPPGEFIPVLERYGFVSELDKIVWRQVCAWLRSWIDRGHTPVPVSVNISQTDILTLDVPEYLDSLIRRYDLPREALKLEITESAYVSDMDSVRGAVVRLRELGFRVLMDDFGSGYSSLNMLGSLGVDVVKLDAHFLHLEKDDQRGMQILEAVIDMTRRLSLPIIVEGVETEEHVRFLQSLGCRYVQGYYFYRPMPPESFEALIGDEGMVDRAGVVFISDRQLRIREFLDESIYSEAMLNNIIGAVAFYAWDGKERVDIVRFNAQFRSEVSDPAFEDRVHDILRFLHPADREHFLALLRGAEQDRLNGAAGEIGVYRTSGELGRFLVRVYYLEEQAAGRIFYASLREVSARTNLQDQLRLLSRICDGAVFFALRRQEGREFRLAVYGLEARLGMDWDRFQQALNDGTFLRMAAPGDREALKQALETETEAETVLSLRLNTADGACLPVRLRMIPVGDPYSDVAYLVYLRPEDTAPEP